MVGMIKNMMIGTQGAELRNGRLAPRVLNSKKGATDGSSLQNAARLNNMFTHTKRTLAKQPFLPIVELTRGSLIVVISNLFQVSTKIAPVYPVISDTE